MSTTDRTAQLLVDSWNSGTAIDRIPDDLAPTSRAEAYAIQTRLGELRGSATLGWKIAATSRAGQEHINVAGPLAGRVLDGTIDADGAEVPLAGNAMRLAEPEFVFVMAKPLAPREEPYSPAEVMAAVGSLRFGLEFPSSRYTDVTAVGADQLIADNAVGHRFLLGPEAVREWDSAELKTTPMTATVEGSAGRRTSEGIGAAVLGDPVDAMTWMANELVHIGHGLEAGQFVTTGTCCPPIPVEPGDALTARFGDLGAVTCSFVE